MIIKNWLEDAVDEIFSRSSSGEITRTRIKEIIKKHCPFKPNTAYEEVKLEETTGDFSIRIKEIEISDQYCKDILVTCVEGGSNYWAEFRNVVRDTELDILECEVRDAEDDGEYWKTITIADIRRGVKIATSAEFKLHYTYKRMILEDDNDVISSDAVLQAAVFGTVVYG